MFPAIIDRRTLEGTSSQQNVILQGVAMVSRLFSALVNSTISRGKIS